jgi:hypothetical protein
MDYEKKITTKWIGTIIREKLGLKTQKSHGIYQIPPAEWSKLERLYEKYGHQCQADRRAGERTARQLSAYRVTSVTWGTLEVTYKKGPKHRVL